MQSAPAAQAANLERRLSAFDCVMIVAGCMVGTGIFINPSEVARTLESPPAILLAWACGGVAAMLGGIAFSKLGRFLPHAGGIYVYLRDAYHPAVAFLYGWTALLAVFSGVSAAVALTWARYLVVLFPAAAGWERTAALLLIAALTGINYRGVRLSGTVQNLLSITKFAAVALLVLMALGTTGGSRPTAAPAAAPGVSVFLFSLLPVLMSYGGWYTLSFMAGDIRRPERSLPIGILGGTALVIATYTLVTSAYLRVLTVPEIAASHAVAATMAARLMGPAGAKLIAALILVSAPAVVNVLIMAGSRVYFAMARDGLFFRSAAQLHPRHGSPVYSIFAQAGWSALLVLTQTYGQLLQDAMFAEWTFFALTGAAVFVFAARRPGFFASSTEGRFIGTAAALFVLAAGAIVVNTLYRSPRQSLVGLALILAGLPVYALWRRHVATPQQRHGT